LFGLSELELKTIINVLKSNDVKECIIFGSRAKGNYKKGSDIDIAIVGNNQKISYLLNEETNIPYFFDVIDLDTITNSNLLEHINRVGKVIFPINGKNNDF
jgi:uncharacterized protein